LTIDDPEKTNRLVDELNRMRKKALVEALSI